MANSFADKRKKMREREIQREVDSLETIAASGQPMDLQGEAYANRIDPNADGAVKINARKARNELFTRHFEWIDARLLTPNPDNYFKITNDDIEALADLILETGHTDPITVREVGNPDAAEIQIVDGERRYRAHLRLGEREDEKWFMIPTRYYRYGELDDESAAYLMSAENIGQRNMTQSDRAQAFAAVADRIEKKRMEKDPTLPAKRTREILAEQFGISARAAAKEVNIGRHLVDRGMKMLDERKITKDAADALAMLTERDQEALLDLIESGELKKGQAEQAAREMRKPDDGKKRAKADPTLNGYMGMAFRSLSKASKMKGKARREDIAKIRNLLDGLDPDRVD